MGNNLQCHMGESVEEIFNQIYKAIPLDEIEVFELYQKYLTCITTPQSHNVLLSQLQQPQNQNTNQLSSTSNLNPLKSSFASLTSANAQTDQQQQQQPSTNRLSFLTLDYFNFNTMLNLLIYKDSNKCKAIHQLYFDNLRKMENNVAIIGTMFIYLSKGVKEEKIELLTNLYTQCFNSIHKEVFNAYVKGIINANTSVGVYSFGSALGNEGVKKMNDIFSEKRRRNLNDYIMNNYGSVYYKYYKKDDVNVEYGVDGNNAKIVKEFFELVYSMLEGEYIRNWLSEEYEKDKPKMEDNPCLF